MYVHTVCMWNMYVCTYIHTLCTYIFTYSLKVGYSSYIQHTVQYVHTVIIIDMYVCILFTCLAALGCCTRTLFSLTTPKTNRFDGWRTFAFGPTAFSFLGFRKAASFSWSLKMQKEFIMLISNHTNNMTTCET
jgi:hypothetical protein